MLLILKLVYIMLNYPSFHSESAELHSGQLGRVQVSKQVVYKSEDSEPYETTLTQFKQESRKSQIDQDLCEADFKLSTLLELGSVPDRINVRPTLSKFDAVDLTLLNLTRFGNSECNFVQETIAETPIVEPTDN